MVWICADHQNVRDQMSQKLINVNSFLVFTKVYQSKYKLRRNYNANVIDWNLKNFEIYGS